MANLGRMMKGRKYSGRESVLWCFTLVLISVMLFVANARILESCHSFVINNEEELLPLDEQPCEEFYVVKEGDTMYSIAEKCNDPFIWAWNQYIEDPDDVVPGVTLKINHLYD